MEMKQCRSCGIVKPFTDFYRNGPDRPHKKQCKKCEAKQAYERRKSSPAYWRGVKTRSQAIHRRKKGLVSCLKAGKPCVACGRIDSPRNMHFHHLDPTSKLKPVADLVAENRPVDAICNEIAKCVLVCSACHCELHGDRLALMPHVVPPKAEEVRTRMTA